MEMLNSTSSAHTHDDAFVHSSEHKTQTLENILRPVTPQMLDQLAPLYKRIEKIVPYINWLEQAPYVDAILRLKKQKNAVILAHNYQSAEIFNTVADIVGDSLQLALEAEKVEADIILMCGVHFMAETSKILNPNKTVLIPDMRAGCSLAESITVQDIENLRKQHPGVPVVVYVNTSAAVKAAADVCCTSSNALQIVEGLESDEVLFLPDQYLANWVAKQTTKKIISWNGACEVHERFTGAELNAFRKADPKLKIIAHPECPPDVIEASDFSGSTAKMINWVETKRPERVMLVTECSMADNVAAQVPDVEFIRPCNLCPHMKRITLPKILDALIKMKEEVEVDPQIAIKARNSLQRMIEISSR